MDSKDRQIIDELRKDARVSIRDLAGKIKLKRSTVHDRITKLVSDGVIEKFTVKLNNKAVGENFIVFMFIKGSTTDYIDSKFLHNKNVKEVFGITGEYDVLLKLKFQDIEEFNDFVLKFRRENKQIQSTLTMVTTANIKEEV